MRLIKPLIGVAGVALATGIAVPTLAAGGNKYDPTTSFRDCSGDTPTGDSGDYVQLVGPLKLWPPNHKFVDEPVTATSGNPDDNVTITITPSLTDAAGGDGGPQHDPDYTTDPGKDTLMASGTGTATAAMQLRAERSGTGDGRTYTLNWSAMFGNRMCSSDGSDENHQPFVITVPHDMSGGADWKAVRP